MITHKKRVFSIAFLLAASVLACKQDLLAQTEMHYPETADGLKSLLQDAIAAARDHDSERVAAFVKQMEIPDYQEWWRKTYGKERSETWVDAYRRDLVQNEDKMQTLLSKVASEDGEVFTRSVNGAPQQGKRGLEWGLVHSAKQRVQIFRAEWRDSAGAAPDFFGYFFLIDHGFRWDTSIQVIPISRISTVQAIPPASSTEEVTPPSATAMQPVTPGKNGVGYPMCLYCPSPPLTKEAKDAKFQGAVLLQVVVGPDGHASDIQVIKKIGYGLEDSAVEAVKNWRFKPAAGPDGKPVAVVTQIEITFRQL